MSEFDISIDEYESIEKTMNCNSYQTDMNQIEPTSEISEINDIIKRIDELQKLQNEQDKKFEKIMHEHETEKKILSDLQIMENKNDINIQQLNLKIYELHEILGSTQRSIGDYYKGPLFKLLLKY